MNKKLVFVGIMAIVAAVGLATTVIPFQSAHAVSAECKGSGVNVQICGTAICANAAVIARQLSQGLRC